MINLNNENMKIYMVDMFAKQPINRLTRKTNM